MYSYDSDSDNDQAGAPAPVAAPAQSAWHDSQDPESQMLMVHLNASFGSLHISTTASAGHEPIPLPAEVGGIISVEFYKLVNEWREANGLVTMPNSPVKPIKQPPPIRRRQVERAMIAILGVAGDAAGAAGGAAGGAATAPPRARSLFPEEPAADS